MKTDKINLDRSIDERRIINEKHKFFKVAHLHELHHLHQNKFISYSRMVELINEMAFDFYKENRLLGYSVNDHISPPMRKVAVIDAGDTAPLISILKAKALGFSIEPVSIDDIKAMEGFMDHPSPTFPITASPLIDESLVLPEHYSTGQEKRRKSRKKNKSKRRKK